MVARAKTLRGHIDEWYRGFDLNYLDANRADRFLHELKRFETRRHAAPANHSSAQRPHAGREGGKRTPIAFAAEHDVALGRIVEAISHSNSGHNPLSSSWRRRADGADHVDAHRTVAFVISPYTKRHAVDSTMYSTSSMLRTIE